MIVQRTSQALQLTLTNCRLKWNIFSLRACSCFRQPAKMINSHFCRKTLSKGLVGKKSYTQCQIEQGHVPRTQALTVSVLCSGAYDEARSVLVHSAAKGYLFNAGEGTQLHLGTSLIQDIFLTYNQWENIGGLYGVSMSIYTPRGQPVNLHGPPNVEQILQMTKGFGDIPSAITSMKKIDIDVGSYSDWQMGIEYVKLPRVKSGDCDNKSSEAEGSKTEIFGINRLEEEKKAADYAVAYILRVNEKTFRGKADTEKIRQLGVKRPYWVTELHDNGTAVAPDGTVVKKEDVFGATIHHHPVVILECPHLDFLPSLTSSEQLLKLPGEEKDEPCLIVHMSPSHVVEVPEYQEFMNRFKNSNHLMLNAKSKPHVREQSAKFHVLLNQIHPGVFPDISTHSSHAEASAPQMGRVIQGEAGLKYDWFQESGFDWSSCQVVNKETTVQNWYKQYVSAGDAIKKWRKTLDSLPKPKDKRPYPEIVFLGTGSSRPSPIRNASGILLHLSPEKCMLLDCGEGACEQIRSFYGDKADDVFRKLTAVFVSHLHCDHHLGFFGILTARRKALQKFDLPMTRLNLLAPIQIQRWLFLYCKLIMNFLDEIQLIRHISTKPMGNEQESVHQSILESLDLEEFITIGVNHVPYSYGLSMRHKDGWKLVYSGDTMPCQRLIDDGLGCDLLIHEATFCDMLEHDALAKNHSTTSQAIHVAKEMKARFTILTHFSQRYKRTPVFTDKFTDDIGFSFDLMKVTRDDLHVIPHLKEVLEQFFHDYEYMKRIRNKRKHLKTRETRRTDVNILYDSSIPKRDRSDKKTLRADVNLSDQSVPKRSRPDKAGKDIAGPARETDAGDTGIEEKVVECETEKTIGVEGIVAEKL